MKGDVSIYDDYIILKFGLIEIYLTKEKFDTFEAPDLKNGDYYVRVTIAYKHIGYLNCFYENIEKDLLNIKSIISKGFENLDNEILHSKNLIASFDQNQIDENILKISKILDPIPEIFNVLLEDEE